MARLQRQWVWFVFLAVVSLVLAGSSIAGWLLYIRAARAQGAPPEDLVRLQAQAAGLEKALADRQGRLDTLQAEFDETVKALARAEARLAGTDDLRNTDQSRVTAAERDRADAQARADAADRARTELEMKLAAAERAYAELEAKLTATEQARMDAETKLGTVSKALAEAESRADEAQRLANALKEQTARLEADVQRYRQEAQEARAEERQAVAKWQEALTARLAGGPDQALATAPAASGLVKDAPPVAPDRGGPEPRLVQRPPEPPARTVPETLPAAQTPLRPEGTVVTAVVGRDPQATRPEEEDDDLALKDAKAPEVRGWGEAMIVGGNPRRAVTLIRKAIEMGGEGAAYQKSLGWALLWAGREQEAKAALEAALAGFEDWPATSANASPDHWTAAFLLGKVPEDEYTRRYVRVSMLGYRLDCLPWFYVGQRREMEGHREEAITAYRACVGLGQLPNAYPIWRWANQRIEILSSLPTSAPAQ